MSKRINKTKKVAFIGPLLPKQRKQKQESAYATLERGISMGLQAAAGRDKKKKNTKSKKGGKGKGKSLNGLDFMHSKKMSSTDPVKQYAVAVRNPFNPITEGVRVPDLYSFPVETGHCKGRFSLIANATSKISVAVLPNPLLSMVDINLNSGGAACIANSSMTPFTANPGYYGATTPASLDIKFNSSRVVASGVKIRVAQPELVRTGVVIFAPFPCVRGVPGWNALNTTAMVSTSAASGAVIGGANPASIDSSSILGMPGAFMMSLADLGRKDVILPFRMLSAVAQDFKQTNSATSYNATAAFGDSIIENTATGVIIVSDLEEVTTGVGFSGWFIYCDQFNDTSTADAILGGEYVYHLEGCPSQAPSTAVGALINDSCLPPVVEPSSFQKIISEAAKLPWAEIIPAGMSAFGVGSSGGGYATGYTTINY